MTEPPTYLITAAGGGAGGISPRVVEQLLARGEAVRAMTEPRVWEGSPSVIAVHSGAECLARRVPGVVRV
jgi:hypothetical protein